MADKYPVGLLGGIGLVIFSAGLFSLARMPVDAHAGDIVWRMAVTGIGFGLFQSPNNRAMIGSAPRERSGGASGMLGTARLLGQTTGAALAALIFARSGEHGERIALYLAAAVALAAAVVSATRLMERTTPRSPADGESSVLD